MASMIKALRKSFGSSKRDPSGKVLADFNAPDLDGNSIPLSTFAGKVCLIVNVASK